MERTLPKHVIIQSNQNHRYLCIDKNQYRDLPNALLFEGDYSFGLKTRFEVVPATTETGLVHIRSLQNRRYLTHFGTANRWIAASAVEPEEDQSKEYCTLFQPVFLCSDNNRVARLRHVNTGNYVRRFDGNRGVNRFVGCLTLLPEQRPDDNTDVFTFIDRETVVVLPDRIRLKHVDGGHLQACNRDGLRFREKADNSSMFDYEVIPSRDGGSRLKSVRFGKYWTEMSGFLTLVCLQEASPTTHEPDTVFIPTIDGGNCIGFRCLKSNFPVTFRGNMIRLVGLPRLSIDMAFQARAFATEAVNPARATYPGRWCYMKIEESAVSRKIDNVIYDLTDVRRYNEKTSALVTDDSVNRTQLPQTSEISLKTTVTNESSWSTSVSVTVSQTVNMSLKMDFAPFCLAGSAGTIGISNQVSGSYNWGEKETSSVEVGSVRTVTVPPMSRVKATLMETRISYDIPFSYRQSDVFMDGSTKVTEKDDGIFTGHNGYGYSYEIDEIPLEPR